MLPVLESAWGYTGRRSMYEVLAPWTEIDDGSLRSWQRNGTGVIPADDDPGRRFLAQASSMHIEIHR